MSATTKPSEVLLVAAEASSELYARRILEECGRRNLQVKFYGIGSSEMVSQGFDMIENSKNMAVVGLWEVLEHWSVISGAFKGLLSRAKTSKPDAALLLDYPDFNLRLAAKLHKFKIPVMYLISPQIWAWRTGRVHLIKKIISKMLVVFPFEEKFYEGFNVPVKFVGHPLLDEIKGAMLDAQNRKMGRQHLGVNDGDFLVGLLPGSRKSEIKYNFLEQVRAATLIAKEKPQARFLLLVAPSLEVETLRQLLPADLKIDIRLVKDDPFKVMQLCDACIVASGTATLLTGLATTPMVIMYRMAGFTGFMAKRLVKGQFFGMANLILGERAVPELFQEQASGEGLAKEVLRYINEPQYHAQVRAKLSQIKEKLGNSGAVTRVVDQLEILLKEKSSGASQ